MGLCREARRVLFIDGSLMEHPSNKAAMQYPPEGGVVDVSESFLMVCLRTPSFHELR